MYTLSTQMVRANQDVKGSHNKGLYSSIYNRPRCTYMGIALYKHSSTGDPAAHVRVEGRIWALE